MYLTEKDLKLEIRQVNATINELASDQAGDIRFLHQELVELREQVDTQNQVIQMLKDRLNEP
tara:strand:- start:322 stop:507 length:186 start_codon:yes stop_codon:yes gene_type:complete